MHGFWELPDVSNITATQAEWAQNASMADLSAWRDGDGAAHLTRLWLTDTGADRPTRLFTSATNTGTGLDSGDGPDLIAAWEAERRGCILLAPGLNPLVFSGPDFSGNSTRDATERYVWRPGHVEYTPQQGTTETGIQGWITDFRAARSNDGAIRATFGMFDGVHDIDAGDAAWTFGVSTPAVTVGRLYDLDVDDVAWRFQVSQPQVDFQAGPEPPPFPSLLPSGATAFERALEEVIAPDPSRADVIGTLWDPQRCPLQLLPWLAWSLSVDDWEDDWSEEQKRAVVAASIEVHRRKGTVGAMRRSTEALGFTFSICEWWQETPPGPPCTAKVFVGKRDGTPLAAQELARVAERLGNAKRAALHIEVEDINTLLATVNLAKWAYRVRPQFIFLRDAA